MFADYDQTVKYPTPVSDTPRFSLADRVAGRDKLPLRPIPSRMARRNIARLLVQLQRFRDLVEVRLSDDPGDEWDIELRDFLAAELAYLRATVGDPIGHFLPADGSEGWG